MAREATGQVLERKGKRGITYAARVRAYGERHYLSLGFSWEGYDRRRGEIELQNILADIRRCIWKPPQLKPVAAPAKDPTFHEFSSQWFESRRHEVGFAQRRRLPLGAHSPSAAVLQGPPALPDRRSPRSIATGPTRSESASGVREDVACPTGRSTRR